jgi:hypothetical protein
VKNSIWIHCITFFKEKKESLKNILQKFGEGDLTAARFVAIISGRFF